jgi:hypothetical protein
MTEHHTHTETLYELRLIKFITSQRTSYVIVPDMSLHFATNLVVYSQIKNKASINSIMNSEN